MTDTTTTTQSATSQLEPLQVGVVEAGRLLGYSRATSYERLQSGELPSTRQGTARRIPLAALRAWVEAHSQPGI
jgi:excisionase family DNA binding protein